MLGNDWVSMLELYFLSVWTFSDNSTLWWMAVGHIHWTLWCLVEERNATFRPPLSSPQTPARGEDPSHISPCDSVGEMCSSRGKLWEQEQRLQPSPPPASAGQPPACHWGKSEPQGEGSSCSRWGKGGAIALVGLGLVAGKYSRDQCTDSRVLSPNKALPCFLGKIKVFELDKSPSCLRILFQQFWFEILLVRPHSLFGDGKLSPSGGFGNPDISLPLGVLLQ